MSVDRRRQLIDPDHPNLSIVRQCELVSVSRSTFYREPTSETALNLTLMRLVDEQFLETPWYGSRQMMRYLRRQGHSVGRERVRRLMAKMGLAAIYQRPRTTVPHPAHRIYPYLLREMTIDQPNQVWCTDITYIPMRRGFLYLVAVMDWSTRKVLSWRVSNTMEVDFCIEALEEAMDLFGRPTIFNSDQGSQFTSPRFTEVLTAAGFGFPWTVAVAGWTMCSLSACGAASSMNVSTFTRSKPARSCGQVWLGGSTIIIPAGRTPGWMIARRTRRTPRSVLEWATERDWRPDVNQNQA
jgi:putative transposase